MPIEAIFLSAIAIIFLVVAFVCIGLGMKWINFLNEKVRYDKPRVIVDEFI